MISALATRVKVAIAIGAIVRIAWWIVDRPIWLDEAMLALGVIHRPLGAPLLYGQLAPPGFVLAQWSMVALFGASGRALRAAPLVASLVALPLFARLARRVLREDPLVVAAVWLFAINRALVAYAVEAKPYAWDVTAAIALTLVVLWAQEGGALRALTAGALGATIVWCSYPAVIVLGALGALWFWRQPRHASIAIGMWAASAAPAIWIAERAVTDRNYLRAFWADGFPSSVIWPITQSARVLDDLLKAPPGVLWLAAIFAGTWLMRRRQVMAPIVAAMAAAVAGLYPFASRLALFLVPSALLAVAAIGRWWIIAALVAVQSVTVVLPERHEDMRALAKSLAAVRRPGDAVYVYYGAIPTFAFYADTTGTVRGGCHRDDWPAYLHELDALRGRPRVWLVVAHAFDRNGVQEDSLLVRYLSATGRAVLTMEARDAFATLYDLSDARNAVNFHAPASIRARRPNLQCL
jgi:hypothetical protein